MSLSDLFGLYVEVGLILFVMYPVWMALKMVSLAFGAAVSHHRLQTTLRLVFIAVFLFPILVRFFPEKFLDWGPLGLLSSFQLSEMIIALYFQGYLGSDPLSISAIVNSPNNFWQEIFILIIGWKMIVAIVLTAWFSFQFITLGIDVFKLRRVIENCYSWKINGAVNLLISSETAIPFSARFMGRNLIVIPSALLPYAADLRVAIAHEGQHLRNRDTIWENYLQIVKLLYFWNPAIYLWKREFDQARELACDEIVLKRRSISQRAYGDCLLRVCKLASGSVLNPRFSIGMISLPLIKTRGSSFLLKRIRTLGPNRQSGGLYNLYSMSAVMIVLVFSMSVLVHETNSWSVGTLSLDTMVNLHSQKTSTKSAYGLIYQY